MRRPIALGLALALLMALPAAAGDFQKGLAAYDRGDYATALNVLRPLAKQGHAKAQYYLGAMHATGRGVPQDYMEAKNWYRKAAEQGFAKALSSLGFMHMKGLGVPRDNVQAYLWFSLSAALGDKTPLKIRDQVSRSMRPAQIAESRKLTRQWLRSGAEAEFFFGQKQSFLDFDISPGNTPDTAKWLKVWRRDAEQGDVMSQRRLGGMYLKGDGVPQDFGQALKWFRKAARQGHPPAQYDLAMMYADGQGIPMDRVSAHLWFSLAVAGGKLGIYGLAHITNELDAIAKQMTPEQLSRAEKLAREWLAQHDRK